MPLLIASLNSGSNGNCYYVGNQDEAVLIDAGISCRETEKRMLRIGLNICKVKAIFISHEHSDHICGVASLSKKFRIPVYITRSTHSNCRLMLDKDLIRNFTAEQPVSIGKLQITGFTKCHDAADPHSFIVCSEKTTIGVLTDIGVACEEVVHHFKQCHAAFLEANYDDAMLTNGNYPYHLKKRISGRDGHLSNAAALRLFLEERAPWLSHLILSHISKNNNTPGIVQQLFETNASGVRIIVASRYEETAVFEIIGAGESVPRVPAFQIRPRLVQLKLF
ncbi:MAG: MBL fold metallo-hydrolase [Chitinophagaceae bacterium]